MTLRDIKWKLFGRPAFPPKDFKVIAKINQYTGIPYFPRHYDMARMYLNGIDPWHIAKRHNVTRERVRQCLWKAYQELHMQKITPDRLKF